MHWVWRGDAQGLGLEQQPASLILGFRSFNVCDALYIERVGGRSGCTQQEMSPSLECSPSASRATTRHGVNDGVRGSRAAV